MKNLKIKLISPASIITHWDFVGTKNRILPPYGLGIFTSFLKNKGRAKVKKKFKEHEFEGGLG